MLPLKQLKRDEMSVSSHDSIVGFQIQLNFVWGLSRPTQKEVSSQEMTADCLAWCYGEPIGKKLT